VYRSLAPWKLNRTRSDDVHKDVIPANEWALTLVACVSLELVTSSETESSLERR